jgi:hypothetical protein
MRLKPAAKGPVFADETINLKSPPDRRHAREYLSRRHGEGRSTPLPIPDWLCRARFPAVAR